MHDVWKRVKGEKMTTEWVTEAGERVVSFYNPRLRRWIWVVMRYDRERKRWLFVRWVKEFTVRATASIETGGGHEPFECEITMLFPVTANISPDDFDKVCEEAEDYLKALTYVLFDIWKDAWWFSSDLKAKIKEFQKKTTFTVKELMDFFRIVMHVRDPREYLHTKLKWSERVIKVGWEYLEKVEKELREELEKHKADIMFIFELVKKKKFFKKFLRLRE